MAFENIELEIRVDKNISLASALDTFGKHLVGRRGVFAGVLASLSSCAPIAASDILQVNQKPQNVGCLFLRAPINQESQENVIKAAKYLVEGGCNEIWFGLDTGGGEMDAAVGISRYIQQSEASGLKFVNYNIGVVASAGCYIFLSAKTRLCTADSVFLFHEISSRMQGNFDIGDLKGIISRQEEMTRLYLNKIISTTHMNADEARLIMLRETRFYAKDALRDGVVDAISDYVVPKTATKWADIHQKGSGAEFPPVQGLDTSGVHSL